MLTFSPAFWHEKILSRVKPAVGGDATSSVTEKKRKNKTKKIPRLEDYLNQRDYMGALTLLEVNCMIWCMNRLTLVYIQYEMYLKRMPFDSFNPVVG